MHTKREDATGKAIPGLAGIAGLAGKTGAGKAALLAPLPILLGLVCSLALLALVVLLVAGLILGGVLPAASPGLALSVGAGLCALMGSRLAVGKGSGGPILTGSLTAGSLCLVMLLVCVLLRGALAVHGQFIGTLLMVLAGGWLAGLLGKKRAKKKPRKKKK